MSTPASLQTINVDGWPLAFIGEEPRVRDLDLAERLGYERPRKIRELIDRMVEAGKLPAIDVRPTVGRTSMPNGGQRETVANEYWLTEEEALLVTTQSETADAWALTREIVLCAADDARYPALALIALKLRAGLGPEWLRGQAELLKAWSEQIDAEAHDTLPAPAPAEAAGAR